MANGGYIVMLNVERRPDREAVRAPQVWLLVESKRVVPGTAKAFGVKRAIGRKQT